ncbi:MAG: hypothetical protein KAH23_04245 [Kiritimatiellae bacterium]|nr:hypothetical protein [Kiritimatiellia bacterium]
MRRTYRVFYEMFLAILVLIGLLAPVFSMRAQDAPAEEVVRIKPKKLTDYNMPGLEQKVNLDSLQEPWKVVQIIDFLSHRGGLKNVVIAKGVSGQTTKLKFDNVSIGEALEVVLSVNDLAYEVNGGILTIMTDEEYKRLYGTSFYDHKQVKIVRLENTEPVHVLKMVETVKSSIGTIVADAATGNLILIDTPEKIREMEVIIRKADVTAVTRTFLLQYADVEEMQTQVVAVLSKGAGAVRADKRTKTLIVTDLPHKMEKVSKMIALFDKRSKQVFIEAKIVEIALSDDFSMGVNWQHLFKGIDPRFNLKSIVSPGAPSLPTGQLIYNSVGSDGDINIIIDALKSVGETTIKSNPHIAVEDGKEAEIKVVEKQPYKEVALESGTTNVTGVTYKFEEVGVLLSVIPKINDEGFINLQIRPEISSISQWYDGAPQEGTPVIRKAYADTTVNVKDGVTIIIGGMIKDRKDTRSNRTPFLGSIPLLGRLFRHDTTSSINTETVIFMTPRIITGEEPFQLIEHMKKKPKGLRTVGRDVKKVRPVR